LATISKDRGFKTAGALTVALADFIGSDLATSEVKAWLDGTKLPSIYHLFKLSCFLNTSLDNLFSDKTITTITGKVEDNIANLLSQTPITKESKSKESTKMATTNNTATISITKTSKKQMDEVVRSRTTSRSYNLLLANKIYSSDMTLKMISAKTGASTRSLRDYAFYGVSVPQAVATKLASVLKTSPRNLGLTFDSTTERYNHVKVTVKK
jgi:hypothetical protein